MSRSDQHPDPDEGASETLERRLGFTSQRYQLYFRKLDDIVDHIVADRSATGDTFHSTHTAHISDFISVDEVSALVQTNELRDIDSWARHMEELRETKASELSFDDWPEANFILGTAEDRHDVAAQVYALNDSFSGFIKLLVSWIEHQDDYSRLFVLTRTHSPDETGLQLELADILREEIPELPEGDVLSATIFIMEMLKKEAA